MTNFITASVQSIFHQPKRTITFNTSFTTNRFAQSYLLTPNRTTIFNTSFTTRASSTNHITINRTTTFNTLIRTIILLTLVALLLSSCSPTTVPSLPEPTKNTVILLDLSDRVLLPNQVAADKELLNYTLNQFAAKAKEDFYIGNNDRIRILISKQARSTINWNNYDDSLVLDMATIQLSNKRIAIENMLKRWPLLINQLYAEATTGQSKSDYAGADLWRMFNEVLPTEFNQNGHNQLIVLSDGYFDFESINNERSDSNKSSHTHFVKTLATAGEGWLQLLAKKRYGLIPLQANKMTIETLVLEVNPHGHYHYEILHKVWEDWLNTGNYHPMGFLERDNLSVSKGAINRLLRSE